MADIIPQAILVILLIFLNAFFSASEYAIVAVRKSRIDELVKKGDFIAKLIQRALEDRENYIFTAQVGTTIVSLILGWIGEPVIAKILLSFLFFLPHSTTYAVVQTLAVIISLIVLTFISIVFGELLPKTIALYRSEMVSFIVITPLVLLANIFRPFVLFLNRINKYVLRYFGLSSVQAPALGYSREEIRIMLDEIQLNGDFKKDGLEMMQNVFSLSDKPIKYIMTPRNEINAVEINMSLATVLKHANDSYSRFPVYKKTLDNIVGFIHIKDVYHFALEGNENKKLLQTKIVRNVINIPETRKADDVLLDMRKKHIHLAAVYDEFGIMVGIVTLEDIIESLVGEIQDEFDKPLKGITRNPDGTYLIDGNMPLELIQKRFKLPLKGQGYTTVGGVVFGLLGREPHVGDELQIGHLFFEVESIEGRRVKRLHLKRESKKTNHNHESDQ